MSDTFHSHFSAAKLHRAGTGIGINTELIPITPTILTSHFAETQQKNDTKLASNGKWMQCAAWHRWKCNASRAQTLANRCRLIVELVRTHIRGTHSCETCQTCMIRDVSSLFDKSHFNYSLPSCSIMAMPVLWSLPRLISFSNTHFPLQFKESSWRREREV